MCVSNTIHTGMVKKSPFRNKKLTSNLYIYAGQKNNISTGLWPVCRRSQRGSQFSIRYSAATWPVRFSILIFFLLCGCILRGTTSFGMLVSIFEMFWNDVCIHLHSQVQIEPWICKCRADVCGSLRSARFIEEFVYAHAHTPMHTLAHLHLQIFSYPFHLCMLREDYVFKTRF